MTRWGRRLGSKFRQGKTKTGKQKRILTNPEKWILVKATNCPAIIEEPLFSRVQERLKQRGKIAGRQLSTSVMLSGLVYCRECNLPKRGDIKRMARFI